MTPAFIETKSLTKHFDNLPAVENWNWTVPTGSICGLLGPNGAGKTTTLKMLLGMLRPTSGTARVAGYDIQKQSLKIRKISAFAPEDKPLYKHFRVREFLKLYQHSFPRFSETLARTLLQRWEIPSEKKVGAISKGMRSRLLLAAIFSSRVKILILDEPTESLDPAATEEVLTLLTQSLSDETHSILFATHSLDQVQRICDHVTIVDRGKILLHGALDDLLSNWKTIEVRGQIPCEAVRKWQEVHDLRESPDGTSSIITNKAPDRVLEQLRQFSPEHLEVSNMNLREIYLTCTHYRGSITTEVAENADKNEIEN